MTTFLLLPPSGYSIWGTENWYVFVYPPPHHNIPGIVWTEKLLYALKVTLHQWYMSIDVLGGDTPLMLHVYRCTGVTRHTCLLMHCSDTPYMSIDALGWHSIHVYPCTGVTLHTCLLMHWGDTPYMSIDALGWHSIHVYRCTGVTLHTCLSMDWGRHSINYTCLSMHWGDTPYMSIDALG